MEKGSRYTEEDKLLLREVELELLNRVVPAYRQAADRGQIEIATSPFYHPILPLLCDTDIYLRTHPDSPMPRQRFAHPEDAAEQLMRAVACHERLFGRPPVGLWPSEGSVSDAIVPLVERAGFKWMATDELILARTLGMTLSRDGQGAIEHPERLYAPYALTAGGATVACAFRAHALSDLIGFVYRLGSRRRRRQISSTGWPAGQRYARAGLFSLFSTAERGTFQRRSGVMRRCGATTSSGGTIAEKELRSQSAAFWFVDRREPHIWISHANVVVDGQLAGTRQALETRAAATLAPGALPRARRC